MEMKGFQHSIPQEMDDDTYGKEQDSANLARLGKKPVLKVRAAIDPGKITH